MSRSRLQHAVWAAPSLIGRCCRFALELLAFASSCWRERFLVLFLLQGSVVARKCCLARCISFLLPPSQASILCLCLTG